MGSGGKLAGGVTRGDIRLYRFEAPDKSRPVLVLTRDTALRYLSTATIAPITSSIRGVPSEVLLGEGQRYEEPVRGESSQHRDRISRAARQACRSTDSPPDEGGLRRSLLLPGMRRGVMPSPVHDPMVELKVHPGRCGEARRAARTRLKESREREIGGADGAGTAQQHATARARNRTGHPIRVKLSRPQEPASSAARMPTLEDVFANAVGEQ